MKRNLKKLLVFILIANLCGDILSQNSNAQIDFFIAPTISYRKLKENFPFDHIPGIRYDLGFNYKKNIVDKIFVGAGLGYSRMGYNLSDFEIPDTNITVSTKYYKSFFEIPFLFSYVLQENDKKKLLLDFNLVNQVFIGELMKVKQNNEEEEKDKSSYSELKDMGAKTYNIAFQFGGTYTQKLNDKMSLRISPFFKYGLLSLNNVHDYNLGVKLGLGFNL